ncbi:hypothetical protein MOE21_17615 [Bacillus atrophaeus]|uniref:hypothetical protein n=1 Tax=Bacillus atrophaeus TaxID=1452 RepID=UPI0022808B99|nr:hypothetical protein [Bacillus atrophaeus]MCY8934402.1 hypothetical protein [Bacillus atrophaeus]
MPVTEGMYQCKLCEDVFEAKSGEFSKCKCGESEIEPSYFGYTYRNGNKVKTIETKRYYLEDEFVTFPEDIQEIYDEIKRIKNVNGYKYFLFELNEKGQHGEKFISKINLSYEQSVSNYTSEFNRIELSLSLHKNEYRGDQNARKRLQRFLNMMKAIDSNELDVSKRDKLLEVAEKEKIHYIEEPTGETNYTFYF